MVQRIKLCVVFTHTTAFSFLSGTLPLPTTIAFSTQAPCLQIGRARKLCGDIIAMHQAVAERVALHAGQQVEVS